MKVLLCGAKRMIQLKDLVLQRFSVRKRGGRIIVSKDPNGNYKAMRAKDLRLFLTDGIRAQNMFVLMSGGSSGPQGTKWHPLGQ